MNDLGVLRLSPDNFTPPSRTPWGGRRILDELKAGLPLREERRAYTVVGESWEASTDPAFESEVLLDCQRIPLGHLLEARGPSILGEAVWNGHGASLPVLVKYIDAAEDLSVQVHPEERFVGLAPGESGKSEGWYILAAEPGAGVYLGLRDEVGRGGLEQALSGEEDLRPLLRFLPVLPGDWIEVPPGTIHALGRGITMLEVQSLRPRATGVTYRLWDWGRRYDHEGRPCPGGHARQLHLAEALACACCELDGRTLVHTAVERRAQSEVDLVARLPFRTSLVKISPGRPWSLPGEGRYELLVIYNGRGTVRDARGETWCFRRGECLLVPASLGTCELDGDAELIKCG
ncbi:MAG: hypothetical protein A2284_13555 [Deltaproteobacteria bacterium RIFOXYA12_FULL_61_11]|nr:MAG: hypothetical protein A2284_13555 [Deltaproteobacteria bacterium RIFOXYA12_FULL_61_11]